jgi:hypothetical protein
MAFDRAAAKASGYSDEEINAYLQANPEVEKNTPPAPASADAPPPPSTQVPDIDRTNEVLGTVGLGAGAAISGAAGLAKDLIAPAATAYGAYKLNQVANAAINRMGQGPVAPTVGTPSNPIGSPTVTNVPVTGAVAPESVPIQQVAQQTARTAAPAEASMMSRASQMASQYAPAMRAGLGMAGRVAGPAGLAMGAYDAGQVARETDLGGRLAAGQGQRAQQASTNMLNRNVSGYTPNPQEARNLLDSGDERTINMYGGRLKLQGLASPGPNAFNSGFAQQLNRMGR